MYKRQLKNIAITAKELPKALNQECVVDCAFIPGVDGAEETDMYLYPDPNTFTILPWRPQQGKVARLICDIYRPDPVSYTHLTGTGDRPAVCGSG